MKTNCVNCGALSTDNTCQYCGTHTDTIISGVVDETLLKKQIESLKTCTFDHTRVDIIKFFSSQGYRYTTGQIRQFAKIFVYDWGKIECFTLLRDSIIDMANIHECMDIMVWDHSKSDLLDLLTKKTTTKHTHFNEPDFKCALYMIIAIIIITFYLNLC